MNKYLLPLAISTVAIMGCAQPAQPAQPAPQPPRIGLANPASVYCVSLNGKLITKSNDKGDYSICQLPDGTQIEEWQLFRRDHPAK